MWIVVGLVALLVPIAALAGLEWLCRAAGAPFADAAARALEATAGGSQWMAASALVAGLAMTLLGLVCAVRWWRSGGRAPLLGLYAGGVAVIRYLLVVFLLTVGGAILGSSVAQLLGVDPTHPTYWLPGIAGPLVVAPMVATAVHAWRHMRRSAT